MTVTPGRGPKNGKPTMTDTLRDRIAAVQRAHRLNSFGANYVQCECGWKSPEKYATWTDHPEHVADAVIRELELREELRYPNRLPHYTFMPPQRTRYVTGWESCDER